MDSEKTLIMPEDQFRVLFEHASDAHLILNDSGVLDCNDAMIQLLGATDKSQVLARRPDEFSPPFQPDGRRSVDRVAENSRIAIEKGFYRFEWVHRRLNGEPVTVEVTLNPVELNGQQCFIAVWHDLTERKRAENELRRLTNDLQQANHALASANVRMKQDLDAAAKVQQSLLPRTLPTLTGVSFAWSYRPCVELAGDILNVFRLDERNVGLYVLDVSGHGAASALLSVSASHMLSPLAESSLLRTTDSGRNGSSILTPPAEVAARLNAQLASQDGNEQYFTLIYGIFNLDTREFRYVCAGHPWPIVQRSNSQLDVLESSGFPIGMIAEADYEELRVTLHSGDRLFLYSDGVPEAMNPSGEQFTQQRLLASLRQPREKSLADSVDALTSDVEGWCSESGLSDDVSILALEVGP